MRGLSLVAASGGHSSSRCVGLSLSQPLLLRSTGSRRAGSAIVAHGPSRSAACGIFLDQGLNPCPLHWQADSQPLRHQGSPFCFLLSENVITSPSYLKDIFTGYFKNTSFWALWFLMTDLQSFPLVLFIRCFSLNAFKIFLFLVFSSLQCI